MHSFSYCWFGRTAAICDLVPLGLSSGLGRSIWRFPQPPHCVSVWFLVLLEISSLLWHRVHRSQTSAKFCRDDFRDYAEICFRELGNRVKHWITFNEPWSYSAGGYAMGFIAPGRCSAWEGLGCAAGDSGREPYVVAHHQLLAHAAAVSVYRRKYQVRRTVKS